MTASWANWMQTRWVRGCLRCMLLPAHLTLPPKLLIVSAAALMRISCVHWPAGAEAGLQPDLSNVLVIGRKDYVLRSVHPKASSNGAFIVASCECGWHRFVSNAQCPLSALLQYGMQWNVTWGRFSRLAELEVQPLQQPGAICVHSLCRAALDTVQHVK